jgi:hypothetical protein
VDLVRKEYNQHYEGDHIQGDQHDLATADFGNFGNISVATGTSNELDKFLREPVENVKDMLQWWFKNRAVYPKLSQMALDYLSIPPTSTAVECVFSKGRQLLPFTRNGLSAASMRSHLCLGSWACADLIQMKHLEAAIKVKKRKHVSSGVEADIIS